ncbi:endonuclease/exonuclease/phosphatase family protein [Pedobacter sp. SYSU D00535]|uniref:endonuclease/exonuclease/phosphatase family protein n=1 Tax=Pedobacter sp. SYSU D00535 TaxID=2810308 RepID=UPI001A97393A|nr:endonuclease/exonuclease/phosphatase family protein [Pedobacter sp. SYSU D00535]
MYTVKLILEILSCLVVLISVIPFIRSDYWAFRVFEYPRFQKFLLSIALFAGLLVTYKYDQDKDVLVVLGLLFINTGYLTSQILPFTQIGSKQVLKARNKKPENCITLVTANVYQYNRKGQEFIKNINAANPDVILLLETDTWWVDQASWFEQEYKYCVKVPLENTYGIALYSRLELVSHSVNYLVQDDVPSIEAIVRLPNKQKVQLFCLHPTPPVPGENPRSTERDKELLIVAERARSCTIPVIVLGDLNDVAWSYTTSLFCKISGLLDPRRGRGFFNTFHAQHPVLRFPLDHVFCSVHFKLVEISRLPSSGSDHFPMYVQLQYEELAKMEQKEPSPDIDDLEVAQEKIAKETE